MAVIRWNKKALQGLEALLNYIAKDDPNLAAVVGERIDAAVARLTRFPESAPYFGLGLHRLSVRHLPYSCYYRIVGDVVQVISVRHDKQSPLQ